ncbi:MarR family winged helix-turn-helix transcriptional regulator [Methylobacterium sp. J-077]|uniref:MarR family winged helix-turn-helix transcriptional regulator n=1 Tax=Methylobacterium sp. J-077 TaxID=2836656 RepID=UPI001FBBFA14|nr:MarR family winged helix-turn-helix transcriptional regulator [Methylobacterium sp. J-077]MCJ2122550.1 MarR family winged helix-turn-helix transcriptional regulator [Methylobacterium sp. J-077]
MSALPEAGHGKRGVDGHLGYLLRQAAHAHRQRVEQRLSGLGLTLPQFSVLTMLAAYPGHSSADLARLALVTPQTMSVIVANLMKAGLVARTPHRVHGRIQTIALTEAGETMLAAAKKRVYALEADMLAALAPEAQAAIHQWLTRIAQPDAD